jgi:hypothetical protein
MKSEKEIKEKLEHLKTMKRMGISEDVIHAWINALNWVFKYVNDGIYVYCKVMKTDKEIKERLENMRKLLARVEDKQLKESYGIAVKALEWVLE